MLLVYLRAEYCFVLSLSLSLSLSHTSETAFEFSTLFLCSLALGLIIFDDMEPLNLSFL